MHLRRILQHAQSRCLNSVRERAYQYAGLDYTRPLFIRCTLTERCNYRCLYCSHWKQDHYPDEMSLDEWKSALLSLRSFVHPLVVQMLGGEPFSWPGFLELVEFCHAKDIDWGVITNGSAFKSKIVKRVVAAQPANIDISVDASESAVHDLARGRRGSFDEIAAGIQNLIVERDKANARFPIRVKCTVHRLNFNHLEQLADWAFSVGVTSIDFSPVRLWQKDLRENLWLNTQEELTILEQNIERLVVRKQSGQNIETSIPKLRSMVSHFRGDAVQHGAKGCRAGLRDYMIGADGDVSVCSCRPPIGNVRQGTAEEIWMSAAGQQARMQSLSCSAYTTPNFATACTAHRSLLQDVKRGLMLFSK